MNLNILTIKDGLLNKSAIDIIQDKDEFMWFAIYGGLNRYDGYNFIIYQFDLQDSTSIVNNAVNKLYEDKRGKLWIGTLGGGLNKIDRTKEKFYW